MHALRQSKQTIQTSTGPLPTLRQSKPTLRTSTASYMLCASQNRLSVHLQPPTCFAPVKTDSPNFCRPLTMNLYRPPTHFAALKTVFMKLYTPPTRFCGSQNRLSKPRQNRLSGALQTYTLRGCENWLPIALHAVYRFCHCENRLLERLHWPTTRFVAVKTDSINFYGSPTHFVAIKTDFPNFYRTLHTLRQSKPTLRTSTASQHALQQTKLTLRTSAGLFHVLYRPASWLSAVITDSLNFFSFFFEQNIFLKYSALHFKITIKQRS